MWIDVGDGNPHPYPVTYPNPTLALASTLTCGPTWATASRARPQPQCLQPSPPLSAIGPARAPASVAVTAEAVAEAEACFSPGKPLSVVSSRVFQNPKYMPKGEDPEVRSPRPRPHPRFHSRPSPQLTFSHTLTTTIITSNLASFDLFIAGGSSATCLVQSSLLPDLLTTPHSLTSLTSPSPPNPKPKPKMRQSLTFSGGNRVGY